MTKPNNPARSRFCTVCGRTIQGGTYQINKHLRSHAIRGDAIETERSNGARLYRPLLHEPFAIGGRTMDVLHNIGPDFPVQRPSSTVSRLGQDALDALASAFVKNEIFTSLDIPDSDVDRMLFVIFPALWMLTEGDELSAIIKDAGLFYAGKADAIRTTEAASGRVYPIFPYVRYIHRNDIEPINARISKLRTQ